MGVVDPEKLKFFSHDFSIGSVRLLFSGFFFGCKM
jgi:hypothetical protein